MAHLSLTFLGSFQATLNGRPITAFRSAKVQGLLAYIALTGDRTHNRDSLAAFLWPEAPDSVAKKNLRQSLYQLRRVLGEADAKGVPHLIATRTTLQFNPDSDHFVDAVQFSARIKEGHYEQALTLYGGDLLAGFTCDSLPFEDWLRQERESLHRSALEAMYELTARSLAQADYRRAQSLAERQLALEPWREEAHRQLMQALALSGERSAALAQYETCRAVLEEDLGAEPSMETKALFARIRGQRSDRLRRSVRHPEHRPLTVAFVGRASEHRTLVRAYEQAVAEGAQVAAIVGEAGIGKTRLAEQFLDWASAQGADIIRGRAFKTSGGLSYQPITQALRQRLESVNAPEDLLSDFWLTELSRILPELRDRYPDLAAPSQEEATARRQLFEAICRLGQAFAERSPVVLFMDDWHWADTASLDVLHYAVLAWSQARAPILVLLTLRQEAFSEDPELLTWLSRIKHDAGYYRLNLGALTGEETEQLAWTLLGKGGSLDIQAASRREIAERISGFSRWLFDESDGQPFFLVETLRALGEEGLLRPDPESRAWHLDWPAFAERILDSEPRIFPGVRDRIRAWLGRLSEPARAALTAAAVLGEYSSFDRLYRVAKLEQAPALAALDELLARQLLQEMEPALTDPGITALYRFSHQKLAEVAYQDAGAARRRILHRRAYEVLRAESVPAAVLAHHAALAGLRSETVEQGIEAGQEAMRMLAVRVAISHYETAWHIVKEMGWPESMTPSDRRDLYAGLGRGYEVAGEWEKAQELYQAMITDARSSRSAALECEALNHLATVHINGFKDPESAMPLLQSARKMAQSQGDRRGMAETEWNLSIVSRMEQDSESALHHGEAALATARELEDHQLVARSLNSLAYAHARSREWDKVGRYAAEASALYAEVGNRILEADSQRLSAWSRLLSGEQNDSLATLRAAYAFSRQIENSWGEAESAWRLAGAYLETGDYGHAIQLAERAAELARIVGQPTMVELALATLGTIQRKIMAFSSAKKTLEEVVGEISKGNSAGYEDWPLGELCAVHGMAGDWDRALVPAMRALQVRSERGLPPMGLTGWYETEALLRGAHKDQVIAELERLEGFSAANKRQHIPLLCSLAVLAEWDGHLNQAVIRWNAAAISAREIGLPGEEWPILARLARAYDRQNDRGKALDARKAAAEIILHLANTIDIEELRRGFLSADVVRSLLASSGIDEVQ